MKSTKQLLYDEVKKITTEFCKTQKIMFDSLKLSRQLNVSRTLVSKYLNEFFKDGIFIKILTRPVYFLDKEVLESFYRVSLRDQEYYDLKDLLDHFGHALTNHRSFITAIGYDTSLNYCILQLQSAVKYPPNGLPVLLYGEPGVGKKYLCRLVFEYAVNEGLIPVTGNLSHLNEQNVIGDSLLNHKMIIQKLDEAKGGLLVIHNIEMLNKDILYHLIDYINTGSYMPEDIRYQGKFTTRVILISNQSEIKAFDDFFLHSIPVVTKIPNLEERPVVDKERLLLYYFRKEEVRLGKPLLLSVQLFQILVSFRFRHNIEEMITCIKSICASAHLSNNPKDSQISVYIHHLPDNILALIDKNSLSIEDGQELMLLREYEKQDRTQKIISYFEVLITRYQDMMQGKLTRSQFIREYTHNMNAYYEYLLYEKKTTNEKIKSFEQILLKLMEEVSDKYNLYIPANCAHIMAKLLYQVSQTGLGAQVWANKNKIQLDAVMNYFMTENEPEYYVASEIKTQIYLLLNIELDVMNLLFLIINLSYFNKEIAYRKILGIIIAHGYSTASSMADAANKLVGSYVFEAIDMPLDTSVEEIVMVLRRKIQRFYDSRELIIMVDVGSLEDIGNNFKMFSNMTIGIINNVTTGIAVSVGIKIRAGVDIEEILDTCCAETVCSYKLFKIKEKEDAVIFTSETGTAPTERVIQLFTNSMPKATKIKVVSYDYFHLAEQLDKAPIFEKYNVLFVAGTIQLKLENTTFLTLDNLINSQGGKILDSIFRNYFTPAELEQFNMSLIKNFSLENIMHYLNVLDADKLMDYIETSLLQLQELTGRRFSNSALVGAYIHISNLVERLVTRTLMETTPETPETVSEQLFVKQFEESFLRIETNYNVKVPVKEILYIYNHLTQE